MNKQLTKSIKNVKIFPMNKKANGRDRPLKPAGEFAEQTPSLKLPFVAVLSTTANSQQPTANSQQPIIQI
jgi:hypothetical protein